MQDSIATLLISVTAGIIGALTIGFILLCVEKVRASKTTIIKGGKQ